MIREDGSIDVSADAFPGRWRAGFSWADVLRQLLLAAVVKNSLVFKSTGCRVLGGCPSGS
jgi:hypothetical protein